MSSYIHNVHAFGTENEDFPIPDKINYFLKNFDTFMGSLLARIDEVFSRNAHTIKFYSRVGGRGSVDGALVGSINNFVYDMNSLGTDQTDQWYTRLSNSLQLQQSHSSSMTDACEIIESVREDLDHFHYLNTDERDAATQSVKGKIQLLKNAIYSVAMQTVEYKQLEDLVIHIASVSIHASQVSANLFDMFDAWNLRGWKLEEQELNLSLQVIEQGLAINYWMKYGKEGDDDVGLLQTLCGEREMEINGLRNFRAEKEEENAKLLEKLEEKKNSCQHYVRVIGEYRAVLQGSRQEAQVASLEAELADVTTKNQTLECEVENLKQKLLDAANENSVLKAEVSHLNGMIDQYKDAANENSILTAEVSRLNGMIEQYKESLKALVPEC